MDVFENRGTPKSSILNRVFHYKPSILGYPYFWKHLNHWKPNLGKVQSLPRSFQASVAKTIRVGHPLAMLGFGAVSFGVSTGGSQWVFPLVIAVDGSEIL